MLRRFLDSLSARNLCVNLDPANLAMVIGEDAVEAVHNLKDYIVHTHAKDGVMLKKTNPINIYGSDIEVEELLDCNDYFKEVPLGQGSVDFDRYLAALEEVGYNGFSTIEARGGRRPARGYFDGGRIFKGEDWRLIRGGKNETRKTHRYWKQSG